MMRECHSKAYQYGRNRTLFPWMPEERPDIEMMRYGGIEPTITVDDWETLSFTVGGTEFQVIGYSFGRPRERE